MRGDYRRGNRRGLVRVHFVERVHPPAKAQFRPPPARSRPLRAQAPPPIQRISPRVSPRASPRDAGGLPAWKPPGIRQQRSLENGGSLDRIRNSASFGRCDIAWPDGGPDFDPELGRAKIIEFIERTWDYDSSVITYTVALLYAASMKSGRRLKYRVCWSPVAEEISNTSSACVYFNMDVPTSPKREVEVSYTFQADRKVHFPGRSRYHEEWLNEYSKSLV